MVNRKKHKLRRQLILMNITIILVIVFVFLIVITVVQFSQLHNTAVEGLTDKSYNSQLYVMRYFMESPGGGLDNNLENIAPYFAKYISDTTGVDVQIYDKNTLLADSEQRETPMFESDDIWEAYDVKSYMFVPYEGRVWLSFSSPILLNDGSKIGVIRYLYPMNSEYRSLSQLLTILGVFSLAAIFLSYAVSLFFSKKITRPIEELKKIVSEMKEGNLTQRMALEANNEIDELSDAFNMMCERMEGYIALLNSQQQQQREFFSNTTHQLKTPLTSIIGYSQMIQLNSDSDQVCEDAFVIEEAGETLLKSIENILEEARNEMEWKPLEFTSFNISTMVAESLSLLRPRLDKWDIKVENKCNQKIILHSDCYMGREVLLAILDNSILHSRCNKICIWAEGNPEKREIYLNVKDNGKGISDEDAKYVFKPYYRASNSTASGNGLGLAVCREYMRRLGGNVELRKGLEKGCEFRLIFPMLQ